MQRALICEDDTGIRGLIEVLLRQVGFEVESVGSGADALERIAEREYAVVVLDLLMPGLTGEQIVTAIERDHPHMLTRIIVITAAIQKFRTSEVLSRVAAVLTKPFDVNILRETVRAVAERA